jgi:two-component system phosphate regulon sensor histidine kinase PhoR
MVEHTTRSPRVGVRERVERSVFLSQLLLAAATLLLVAVSVLTRPSMFTDPLYFIGLMVVFGTTGLAASVPWRRYPKSYIVVLPLLDILGLALARIAEPNLGVSFLMVFPVIWMATHFGQAGATGSVIFAGTLLWASIPVRFVIQPQTAADYAAEQAPLLAVVTIMLAFVSSVTFTSNRRGQACCSPSRPDCSKRLCNAPGARNRPSTRSSTPSTSAWSATTATRASTS